MTIARLKLLGTCFVRPQCVWVEFACTKRLSYLSKKNDYQCLQCEFMIQVRNISFEIETNFFFLKSDQGIYNFEETQKSFQDVIEDVCCPTYPNAKCVYLSTNKNSSFYDCTKCKACFHVFEIPFCEQNPTLILLGGNGTHYFARKTSRDY